MRPRPARLAALSLSVCTLTVTAATLWRRSAPDLAGWDEPRLTRELEALGYHVHVEPKDREGAPLPTGHPRAILAGVYASRGEPADWDEVASRPRGDPSAWRGCVVAARGGDPAPAPGARRSSPRPSNRRGWNGIDGAWDRRGEKRC
jgi:hypothetical protein